MGETGLNFSPTSGSDRFPPPVADARRAAERPLGGSHLQSAIWLEGRGVATAPFECSALILQADLTLSASGRIYGAWAEAELHRDWRAGLSIDAINRIGITRNAPEVRVRAVDRFPSSHE